MDSDHVCMMPRCSETDFLPTRCFSCNKSYCSSHISPVAHQCDKYNKMDAHTVQCPLCNAPIAVRPGESADRAVTLHMDTGCTPQQAMKAAETRLNFCSFGNCTRNEIQQIICSGCRQTFCVEHRHAAQHNCIAKRESPPPAVSSTKSGGPRTSPRASSKYIPLVNQVPRNSPEKAYQLPPSSSTGVAPNQLLVRVFAYVPVRSSEPQCLPPTYFSVPLSAPVGRVLDAVTARLDVPNDNHVARNDSEKLWLHSLPRLGQGVASDCICLPPAFKVEECLGPFSPTLGSTRLEDAITVLLCRGQSIPEPIAADLEALQQQQVSRSTAAAPGAFKQQPARSSVPPKESTCMTC